MYHLYWNCGHHAYQKEWTHLRGNNVKITNLNYVPNSLSDYNNPNPTKMEQMF